MDLTDFGRRWVSLASATSMYCGIGLTVGGLCILVPIEHVDISLRFLAGFCIPIGPLYWYFASNYATKKILSELQQWRIDGLISEEELEDLRGKALLWYSDRRFGRGKASLEASLKP